MAYGPGELDILARAFETALEDLPMAQRDVEATKAAIMNGILGAARAGERDVAKLTASALQSVRLCDEGSMDAVMRTAPL